MASITELRNQNGKLRYQIMFRLDGVHRKYISVPSAFKKRDVEALRRIVETLVDAIKTEVEIDAKTRNQIAALPRPLQTKLENAGLITIRRPPTIADVLRIYRQSTKYLSLKASSQDKYESTIKTFLSYYPDSTPVSSLTTAEIKTFRTKLESRYSSASVAGILKELKTVFNLSVVSGLIETTPFPSVSKSEFKNKAREFYIDMKTYSLILANLRDCESRAALAFYRIGGIRRGEIAPLTWSDVDFDKQRVAIHAPKLERYADKQSRTIPLFPELRTELEALWNERRDVDKPTDNVFKRPVRHYSESILAAVKRAGVPVWERLIQNLRASRAREIEAKFGQLAESEWIGHSERTARDHYLSVLDSIFQKAVSQEI